MIKKHLTTTTLTHLGAILLIAGAGFNAPALAEDTPTTDLFGFTEGADIADPGEFGFAVELEGAFGARPSPYNELTGTVEATIGVTDWFEMTPFLSIASTRLREEFDEPTRSATGVAGLGVGFKFKLLDRDQTGFGLAFKAAPFFTWFDEGEAVRGRGYGGEFALMLDRAFIPGQFYGGLNVTFETTRFRQSGFDEDGMRHPWEPSSELGFSAALSTRIAQGVFLGGEVAYLRAYESAGLDRFAGEALFVGPTLFMPVSENVELSAGFSSQVWGRPQGGGARLDLDNFNRHRARLMLAVSF
ncbi:MAG: hypothetical protein ACXIVE_11110 [Salinarimonas sp.]